MVQRRAAAGTPLRHGRRRLWRQAVCLWGKSLPKADLSNKTFVYDPAADAWEEKAPLPGGARGFAAAATLNAKIYVVGGWYVNTVEVYDPATDTWSTAAPMNEARQSPGLTAAPDGRLYVSGGGTDNWDGLRQRRALRSGPRRLAGPPPAERRQPGRIGFGVRRRAHLCRGRRGQCAEQRQRIPAVVQLVLPIHQARLSRHRVPVRVAATGPGAPVASHLAPMRSPKRAHTWTQRTRITYTITLYSDDSTLETASVVDPIPQGTTFGEFGDNAAGATYDAAQNRVQWSGTIPQTARR